MHRPNSRTDGSIAAYTLRLTAAFLRRSIRLRWGQRRRRQLDSTERQNPDTHHWGRLVIKHSPTHSMMHSFTHTLTHSFIHFFFHSVNHSINYPLAHSFTQPIHPLTHPPIHSIPQVSTNTLPHTHLLTDSVTHSLNFSFIHSLIQSIPQSSSHLLTQTTHSPINSLNSILCAFTSSFTKSLICSLATYIYLITHLQHQSGQANCHSPQLNSVVNKISCLSQVNIQKTSRPTVGLQ